MPFGNDAFDKALSINSMQVWPDLGAGLHEIRRVLKAGGMLIVKDHIMNAELTEPRAGAIFALYLLLTARGRDYSFDEVSRWLRDAGFIDVRHEALPSPPFTSSMVIARKP